MAKAWDDMKRLAQSAFNDVANSYQDILVRGYLMPNRGVERDIAEAEYNRLHTPDHSPGPEHLPPEPEHKADIEPEA